MLERIVNISAGSDYKNSARQKSLGNKHLFLSHLQVSSNDTIQISPAGAFLSKIRWKLKKFQRKSDKLILTIEADNFELATEIYESEISHLNNINYRLNSSFGDINFTKQIIIDISAPFNTKEGYEEAIRNLSYIDTMVKRFGYINKGLLEYERDSVFIESVLSDIYSGLSEEFKLINSALKKFIEIYLSVKINSSDRINEKPLIIQRIEII